jgi:hypothetical protein
VIDLRGFVLVQVQLGLQVECQNGWNLSWKHKIYWELFTTSNFILLKCIFNAYTCFVTWSEHQNAKMQCNFWFSGRVLKWLKSQFETRFIERELRFQGLLVRSSKTIFFFKDFWWSGFQTP